MAETVRAERGAGDPCNRAAKTEPGTTTMIRTNATTSQHLTPECPLPRYALSSSSLLGRHMHEAVFGHLAMLNVHRETMLLQGKYDLQCDLNTLWLLCAFLFVNGLRLDQFHGSLRAAEADRLASTMAPHLCKACSSIPADFWSHSHDHKEYAGEVSYKLQTLGRMRYEARRGCQLCAILLSSMHDVRQIDDYRPKGEEEVMYLRRARPFPERAIALGIGGTCGRHHVSRTFFSRIPAKWAKPSGSQENRLQVHGLHSPSHRPISAQEPVNNLDLMRSWLQTCQSEHRDCSSRPTNFLPTRLLDLQAGDVGLDVRLVLTQKLVQNTRTRPTYLTLSHCWGPKHLHSAITDSRNLADRLKRIRFKDLSRTFQDAVKITRELGQRYLWIDSLCIIQDDRNDWAKEAALMAEVYGNSLCTLAALSSRDGTQGCNLVADIQRSTRNTFIDTNWNRGNYPYIRIFEKEPKNWDNEYDGGLDMNNSLRSPLRHRAWVLQEKELSRRSIHFGKDQLLWECRQTKATAQLPWEQWKREEDLIYKREWYELVEDYTLRSVTSPTDKLPALSGLAKRHQGDNDQYLAGIWSSQFPGALLWQSKDPLAIKMSQASKDFSYIAPSWSWASLQGRMSYVSQLTTHNGCGQSLIYQEQDSQRLLLPEETYSQGNNSRMWRRTFRNIKIERASTVPSVPGNPYGAIEAASLTLSGAYVIPVDLPPTSQGWGQESEPLEIRGHQIGMFHRDTADALAGAKHAFFLALQDEPHTPLERNEFQTRQAGQMTDLVMGLVLVKDSHHAETYKRAGLARWIDASLLARSKAQTVKFV